MKAVQHHVTSLDVFRGLAVAAMIVVNNPGNWDAVYPPLVHAHWNGFTFADAVFPSFVFIVGAALPFAFARRLARSGQVDALQHIARRTAVLIALGLVLNLADVGPHLDALRVPGVLQRIALAYAVCAPIVLLGSVSSWALSLVVLLVAYISWCAVLFFKQDALIFPTHLAGRGTPQLPQRARGTSHLNHLACFAEVVKHSGLAIVFGVANEQDFRLACRHALLTRQGSNSKTVRPKVL